MCACRWCVCYDTAWWSLRLVEGGSLVLLLLCVFQAGQQAPRWFFCFSLPSCCSNARLQIEPHLTFDVVQRSRSDLQVCIARTFSCRAISPQGTIALVTRVNWNLKVILSCISMVADGVEFFLKCLLAVCVSSFEASVFIFIAYFLIALFIFLMYSFSMSLYFLDADLLWDLCGSYTLELYRLPVNLNGSCLCCKEAF